MKNKICTISVLTLLIVTGLSCSSPAVENDKKTISVSVLPQKYLADMITGGSYPVNVLVPPGASPASYDATPRQIAGLENSPVYFRIGHIIFEQTWIRNITEKNPDLKVIDLSEGIRLIENEDHEDEEDDDHEHGHFDPHTWMSPVNMLKMAERMYSELSLQFPADSALFRQNFIILSEKIQEIDSLFRNDRNILDGKHFLIYHPALGYLARDYGMVQHVLESGGKEPGPSHMAQIIETVRENNISLIFIQKQFSIENARSLAGEARLELVEIDPLAADWYWEMKRIHDLLVSGKGSTKN